MVYVWSVRRGSEALSFLLLFLFLSPCFAADYAEFEGYSTKMLDLTYERAPQEVHQIVDTLNGEAPPRFQYPKSYVFFEGESGGGKSTLAMAMAYKTGREPVIKSASDFEGEGRGTCTGKLNDFFAKMSGKETPPSRIRKLKS